MSHQHAECASKAERDTLQAQLERAQARIATLEAENVRLGDIPEEAFLKAERDMATKAVEMMAEQREELVDQLATTEARVARMAEALVKMWLRSGDGTARRCHCGAMENMNPHKPAKPFWWEKPHARDCIIGELLAEREDAHPPCQICGSATCEGTHMMTEADKLRAALEQPEEGRA